MGVLIAVARADLIAVTAWRVLRLTLAGSAVTWIAWAIAARLIGRGKS